MIRWRSQFSLAVCLGVCATLPARAADQPPGNNQQWPETLEYSKNEYLEKLQTATDELVATRGRIATERIPMETQKRDAESKVIELTQTLTRMETEQARAETRKAELQAELEGLKKSLSYITTLARDATRDFNDSLLPAESGRLPEIHPHLYLKLQDPAHAINAELALDAADMITAQIKRRIGGDVAAGSSVLGNDNALVEGTFAWVGPEVFFLKADGTFLGTVRKRGGGATPMAFQLSRVNLQQAAGLFKGERGLIPLDPSGGKALRLQEVRGTWRDHIEKGGVIGYIILALGGLALLTTLLKYYDIRHMKVDSEATINEVLIVIQNGALADIERAISTLYPTSRELFRVGLSHLEKPKEVLEDHLYAALLHVRMRVERRLPFLTVIVAAAPLLGLLGTVTGMIKTFTLINVFGTGNAAKLSSGISEALVTTELGLMVAIPTLVVHGYLNRSTQRNLAQMEKYAAEFVAAAAERHHHLVNQSKSKNDE